MQDEKVLVWVKEITKDVVSKFNTYMLGLGFTRSKVDHCMYFKLVGDHLIYLVLYVDDIFMIGNDKYIIQNVKNQLSREFEMKDIGDANFILGMEIKRDQKTGNSG